MKNLIAVLSMVAVVIILMAFLETVSAHPVPDEEQSHAPTKLHISNVVKSISIVPNLEISNNDNVMDKMMKGKQVISKQNLPPSPVGLLRPDTFQFYTFNQNGDVVMKQMSKNEIQSLIASSDGHLPMEIHEPQRVENILSDETKVADVVQNVQNVLKGELNKPPTVMTSIPTIPGHDNSEWSNILPSILSGETESDTTRAPDHFHDIDELEVVVQNPVTSSDPEIFSKTQSEVYDSKPMIPVAVITVEKQPPSHDNNDDANEMQVFHIMNTLTVDKNNSMSQTSNQSANNFESDAMAGASETDIEKIVASTTLCPLISPNCNHHDLQMTKKPDNVLQSYDGWIDEHKNDTTNETDVVYLSIIKIPINETKEHHEEEKSKLPVIDNSTETMYEIEKPLGFQSEDKEHKELEKSDPSKNGNEYNAVDKKKHQSQNGNTESNAVGPTNEQPTFLEIADEIKSTTENSDIVVTPQHASSQSNISMIKFESPITQQILIDNNANQLQSISQISDILTNNQNNVPNETSNSSQTEKLETIYPNKIFITSNDSVSHQPPLNATPSESLSMTVLTYIPELDQKNSSVKIHSSTTTTAPMPYEKFTSHVHGQPINAEINSTNSMKVNDEAVPNEKYVLLSNTTPIALEDSTPTTVSKPNEPIATELATSLSSMISQISQILPPIIPTSDNIYQSENASNKIEISDEINTQSTKSYETKFENSSASEKSTIETNATHNHIIVNQSAITSEKLTPVIDEFKYNLEQNLESNGKLDDQMKEMIEKVPETAIVHIDIMETIPNVDKRINVTLVNRENNSNNKNDNDDDGSDDDDVHDEKTESPMVRIKLTDPISTLHAILESSPVQDNTENSIEIVTLPTNINISANGIGSGLIAGFNSNENTSTPLKDSVGGSEVNTTTMNVTVVNIDSVTEKSGVTLDNTTIPPTNNGQTEFEDITSMPLSNTSKVIAEPITELPSTTEIIEMVNISKCSQNFSSEQNQVINIPSCSMNKKVGQEMNETATLSDERSDEKIEQPLPSTTISPDTSTQLFIDNETIKQDVTTDNSIITESPEVRDDGKTDIVPQVSQVLNKIQFGEQLSIAHESTTTVGTIVMEYVTDNAVKLSSIKPQNYSQTVENSLEVRAQLNDTAEQTSSYPQQQQVTTITILPDIMKNISGLAAIKIKDKKKDDSSIELSGTNKENTTVLLNADTSVRPIQTQPTLNKDINSTPSTNITDKWTLIPQNIHLNMSQQNISVEMTNPLDQRITAIQKESEKYPETNTLSEPKGAPGLDSSVDKLDVDISYFSILCNELAFTFWSAVNSDLSTSRSVTLSPFGMTSMLAMIFLGARSPTSDRMNEVLKLDDVTSFNPHLVFQNITDSVGIAEKQGIANVAFIRELFADQSKVRKLMRFYKKQAEQFYDGMVEQVNFSTISDAVRRKTNFLIRKQTGGRIRNFVKTNTMPLRSPLAALSANVFQTDCSSDDATSKGRDGELYFAVSPAVRQRKLVLIPATVWKAGVLAGYEPSLDATAFAIGGADNIVSTIFVIPGQQGFTASDDNLDLLEQRIISGALHDGAWNKLLKVIVPRPGLELQIPKFSHKSIVNVTAALKMMGLEELFLEYADFKGINGVGNDFHLADVIQMNLFSTCGDENIQSGKTKHHVEIYPASPQRNSRELEDDDDDEVEADAESVTILRGMRKTMNRSLKFSEADPSPVRITRQTKSDDKPRVKLDKPFLYFVRHNPTGLILFMGRFNPRLLP